MFDVPLNKVEFTKSDDDFVLSTARARAGGGRNSPDSRGRLTPSDTTHHGYTLHCNWVGGTVHCCCSVLPRSTAHTLPPKRDVSRRGCCWLSQDRQNAGRVADPTTDCTPCWLQKMGRRAHAATRLLALVLLAGCGDVVAQADGDEPSATATRTKMKIEILPDPTGADSAERVLGRLRDGLADDGQGGASAAAEYEILRLLQPDTLSTRLTPGATAAVDIMSDTSVHAAANTDFTVGAGGSLRGRIQHSANAAVGSLGLDSLGRVSIASAEDAELSVAGDIGAAATGSASLAAAQVQARLAGSSEVQSGGDLDVRANGKASMSGESLDANLRGDLSITGAAVHLAGRGGLAVVAESAKIQSSRGAKFAAAGAVAELGGDGGTTRLESASDLEAVAGNQLRASAQQMFVSASDGVDATASNSARVASSHVDIMASQKLRANADNVKMRVSNDVQAFSGGELTASLSSASVKSRGLTSLAAAGHAEMSAESSSLTLSNGLDLSAKKAKLQADAATLGVSRLSAAAESASLHAVDANLSTSGRVSGYMTDADVLVEGQVSLQSTGNLRASTTELSVESSTTQVSTSQELSATTGTLKVVAGTGGAKTGVTSVDFDCISDTSGGCDANLMRAELAALLGIPLSRLAVGPSPP